MTTTATTNSISQKPNVKGGSPCIDGTRVTVQAVQSAYREGNSPEDIQNEYFPQLTIEQIQAAVDYSLSPNNKGESNG